MDTDNQEVPIPLGVLTGFLNGEYVSYCEDHVRNAPRTLEERTEGPTDAPCDVCLLESF
jgi:hypothetical protein